MDWFERLTGFQECGYEDTRSKLEVNGNRLRSLVNGKDYAIGKFQLVSLKNLRDSVKSCTGMTGRLRVESVSGDVRKLHQVPDNNGALFQVASQFNMLEMVSHDVTPEQGVTRYTNDRTQGPACAIAAGAATIYRNYFVPIGESFGQTHDRQLDGLAPIGQVLSKALPRPLESLWDMRNGYAMCTRDGLSAIAAYLNNLQTHDMEALAGELCVGIHSDVEVTDAVGPNRPVVSQIFCSAVPVAYGLSIPFEERQVWEPFATLILQAAYEATMWAAVLNANRNASNVVLLTRLGGGAFGNDEQWIYPAMEKALNKVAGYDLHVKMVSYGQPSVQTLELVKKFQA